MTSIIPPRLFYKPDPKTTGGVAPSGSLFYIIHQEINSMQPSPDNIGFFGVTQENILDPGETNPIGSPESGHYLENQGTYYTDNIHRQVNPFPVVGNPGQVNYSVLATGGDKVFDQVAGSFSPLSSAITYGETVQFTSAKGTHVPSVTGSNIEAAGEITTQEKNERQRRDKFYHFTPDANSVLLPCNINTTGYGYGDRLYIDVGATQPKNLSITRFLNGSKVPNAFNGNAIFKVGINDLVDLGKLPLTSSTDMTGQTFVRGGVTYEVVGWAYVVHINALTENFNRIAKVQFNNQVVSIGPVVAPQDRDWNVLLTLQNENTSSTNLSAVEKENWITQTDDDWLTDTGDLWENEREF